RWRWLPAAPTRHRHRSNRRRNRAERRRVRFVLPKSRCLLRSTHCTWASAAARRNFALRIVHKAPAPGSHRRQSRYRFSKPTARREPRTTRSTPEAPEPPSHHEPATTLIPLRRPIMARRTRIVATLGPATDHPGVLEALLDAGVDVVRINFSHGTAEEQRR